MAIAVLGEALIDLVASGDQSYRAHPGGSPFNVAIGLARQNMDVHYLSPLSDDEPGNQLRDVLLTEGVQVAIERRSRFPTSLALVTLDSKGVPAYRLYREGVADKDVSADEVMAHLPADLTLFHTGSLAITPSQLPKIRTLFAALRERGVPVSIDINVRLGASANEDRYLSGVRSLLPLCDIVKASDEDLAALALHSDTLKASHIAYEEMHGGLMIATLGEDGAVLHHNDGSLQSRAYPVSNLVDTIGAGDTFHAAFLAAILRDGIVEENLSNARPQALGKALEYACAAAAVNVMRAGCQPPTPIEVEALISATRR